MKTLISARIIELQLQPLFEEVIDLVLAAMMALEDGNEADAFQLILRAETTQDLYLRKYHAGADVNSDKEQTFEPIAICTFCHAPVSGEYRDHAVCDKCYNELTNL